MLDELAIKYGTDKSSLHNNLTPGYEAMLEPRRYDIVRLLEIGVHEGASLHMWHDFLPFADIVGIDCDKASLAACGDRAAVEIMSQADEVAVVDFADRYGPFDIIIDDGSHLLMDQVVSLRCLWPALAPGGLYAIEDMHTADNAGYGRAGLTTDAFVCWLANRTPDGKPRRGLSAYVPGVEGGQMWERIIAEIEYVSIWRDVAFIGKAA